MLITDITPQKRNKDRVNIFIDGRFSFSLPLEALLKTHLKINQEISREEKEKLIKENEYAKLHDSALKFLSYRPHSEKEVIDYLKRKNAGEDEISMILKRLKSLNFIDDLKFTSWFFDQRRTFRPKAKRIIEYELQSKGVSKGIIEQVSSEFNSGDETVQAKKLAEKVVGRFKNLPEKEAFQKLSQYLLRRGFDWETVKSTIDGVLKKE